MSSPAPRPTAPAPSARILLVLVTVGALPRLANLSTFSMWLDEILQTLQAQGSLGELMAALERDVVHPPLDGLLTWLLLRTGVPETARRLLPVALGVATVALLARWTGRRFGARAGLLAGLLAALSPIHVHTSQELRPYALGLCLMVTTLLAFDRLLERPLWRRAALLGLALVGCAYSLYLALLVVVPLAVLLLEALSSPEPELGSRARTVARRLPAVGIAVALAYLPWLRVLVAVPTHPAEAGASSWAPGLVLRRLEHLTVGGLEGDPATWQLVLPGALLLAGLVAGLARGGGRAVVAGALAGTVGVELALVAADHWSNDRYSLVAWPFVVVLLALGLDGVGRLRHHRLAPVLVGGLVVVLLACQLEGIDRDYRRGRPHWGWTARATAALVRPGDRVVVANEWTRICLGHYARQMGPAGEELVRALTPPRRDPGPEGPGCRLLVAGGYPSPAGLVRRLAPRARLLADRGGAGARLYGLTPYRPGRDCVWVVPRDLLPRPASRPYRRWLPGEPAPPPLDFDPGSTGGHLLAGFSGFATDGAGRSFTWAVGRRAVLALGGVEPAPRRLTLTVWPPPLPGRVQEMTLELNGTPLGELSVPPGRQTLTLEVPAAAWDRRENLLTLGFAQTVVPAEVDPASTDPRPLALAFDRLSWHRLTPPAGSAARGSARGARARRAGPGARSRSGSAAPGGGRRSRAGAAPPPPRAAPR